MILERNLDLLKNIIANLQKSSTCKIQLAIAINFTFFSRYWSRASNAFEELYHRSHDLWWFKLSYQRNFWITSFNTSIWFPSINEREWFHFWFSSTVLLHCKDHKINFKRSRSYVGSPEWLKKATINPRNKDDRFFQYAAAVALNFN